MADIDIEEKKQEKTMAKGNYFNFVIKNVNNEFDEDGGSAKTPDIRRDAAMILKFAEAVESWAGKGKLPVMIGLLKEQSKFFGILNFNGEPIQKKYRPVQFSLGQDGPFEISFSPCKATKGNLPRYQKENLGVIWWQKKDESREYTQNITYPGLGNINKRLAKSQSKAEREKIVLESGDPSLLCRMPDIHKALACMGKQEPANKFTADDFKLPYPFLPNLKRFEQESETILQDIYNQSLFDWENLLLEHCPDYKEGTLEARLVDLEDLNVCKQVDEYSDESLKKKKEAILCLLTRFREIAQTAKDNDYLDEIPMSFFSFQSEFTRIRHLKHEIECYHQFRNWFYEELYGKFGTAKRRKPCVIVGPRGGGKSVFSKLVVGWSEARQAEIEAARQKLNDLKLRLQLAPENSQLKQQYEHAKKELDDMEDPEECDDSWFNYQRIFYCRSELNKDVFDDDLMKHYAMAILDDLSLRSLQLEGSKAMFAGEKFTVNCKYLQKATRLDMGLIILLNDKDSVNYLLNSVLMNQDIVLIAPRFFLGSEKARKFQETQGKREKRLIIDEEQKRQFALHDSTEDFWKGSQSRTSRRSSQAQLQSRANSEQATKYHRQDSSSWLSQTSCQTPVNSTPTHSRKGKHIENYIEDRDQRHLEKLFYQMKSEIGPMREYELILQLGREKKNPTIEDKLDLFGRELANKKKELARAFELTYHDFMSERKKGKILESDYLMQRLEHYKRGGSQHAENNDEESIHEIQVLKDQNRDLSVAEDDYDPFYSPGETHYGGKRFHSDNLNTGSCNPTQFDLKMNTILPLDDHKSLLKKSLQQIEFLKQLCEKYMPPGSVGAQKFRDYINDN